MKTKTIASVLTYLFVSAIAAVPSANATVLTFNIRNAPANTALAPTNVAMSTGHPNYGDNVSGLTQTDGSFINNYLGDGGFTPNITVSYSSSAAVISNGGNQTFYYEGTDWPGGVDFLYGSGTTPTVDRKHYITLTPSPGYGIQLNGFNLFGYKTTVNHTVLWKVYAGSTSGALLDFGTATVTANETSPLSVSPLLNAYFQTPIVVELHHSLGNHGALALDNFGFSQVVPEPSSGLLLSTGIIALVRMARRRRTA